MELLQQLIIYNIISNYEQRCTFASFMISNKYVDGDWNDEFQLEKKYALIKYDICGDYEIYQEDGLAGIYRKAEKIYENRYINVSGHATRLLLIEKLNDIFDIADDEINSFSGYSTTFAEIIDEDVSMIKFYNDEANKMYHQFVEQKLKNNQL